MCHTCKDIFVFKVIKISLKLSNSFFGSFSRFFYNQEEIFVWLLPGSPICQTGKTPALGYFICFYFSGFGTIWFVFPCLLSKSNTSYSVVFFFESGIADSCGSVVWCLCVGGIKKILLTDETHRPWQKDDKSKEWNVQKHSLGFPQISSFPLFSPVSLFHFVSTEVADLEANLPSK